MNTSLMRWITFFFYYYPIYWFSLRHILNYSFSWHFHLNPLEMILWIFLLLLNCLNQFKSKTYHDSYFKNIKIYLFCEKNNRILLPVSWTIFLIKIIFLMNFNFKNDQFELLSYSKKKTKYSVFDIMFNETIVKNDTDII